MERWVSNYKSVGERELTDDERRLLARIARRAKLWAVPLWLSWPAALWVFIVLGMAVGDEPGWAAIGITATIVWLALSPPALWAAHRAAKDAKRDLEIGAVEIFEWQANAESDGDARHLLEVTKGSARILGGDSRVPKRFIRVRISEVAAPGANAGRDAFPRRLALNLGGGAVEPIRALSCGELDELRAFSTKLGGFPYLSAALFLSWVALTASSAASGGRDRADWFLTVLLGTLIVLSWHRRIKSLRLKARLDRDIQAAIVEEKSPERYPHPPGTRLPQAVEVLPHSNAVWTIDGEPAGWRKTV